MLISICVRVRACTYIELLYLGAKIVNMQAYHFYMLTYNYRPEQALGDPEG
jgi:hypothetical protein